MDKRSVQVPDIGDFQEVEVIDILVHSGDRIQEEDPPVSYTHLTLPTKVSV